MTIAGYAISGLITLLVALVVHLLTKSYMSDKFVAKTTCNTCQQRRDKDDENIRQFISDVREDMRKAFDDLKKDVKDWIQELKK